MDFSNRSNRIYVFCCITLFFILIHIALFGKRSSNIVGGKSSEYRCLRISQSSSSSKRYTFGDRRSSKSISSPPYDRYGARSTYLRARNDIFERFNVTWPIDRARCKPIHLYYVGRHGIRYPDPDTISRIRQILPSIQRRLIAGGRLSASIAAQIANWRPTMREIDGNRVSSMGKTQTEIVAKILYQYFPDLLDITADRSSSAFEIGVSAKVRTNDTAQAFVRALADLQYANIKANSTAEQQAKYHNIGEIIDQKFPITYNEITMSHQRCKANKLASLSPHSAAWFTLRDSAAFRNIRKRFANLLESSRINSNINNDALDHETLMLIYRTCAFESANFGSSPWCRLFRADELRLFEFLNDIDDHHDAYGNQIHRSLACTVMLDLYRRLNSIVNNHNNNNDSNELAQTPKVTLLFSHEHLLNKLASYLALFDTVPAYRLTNGGSRVCIARNRRRWRSAYVTPFNANFIASLHRCDDKVGAIKTEATNVEYRLVTLFNEIPVQIRGCSSAACKIDEFFAAYRNLTQTCDLDKICPLM